MRKLSILSASLIMLSISQLCWAADNEMIGPDDLALSLPQSSYSEIFDCLLSVHRELQIYSSLASGEIELPSELTPAEVVSGLEVKQLFLRAWALRLTTADLDTPIAAERSWDTLLRKLKSTELTDEEKTQAELEYQKKCGAHMDTALSEVSK